MINKMEFIQKLSIGDIVFLVVAIGIAEAVVFVFLIRYIKKPLKNLRANTVLPRTNIRETNPIIIPPSSSTAVCLRNIIRKTTSLKKNARS